MRMKVPIMFMDIRRALRIADFECRIGCSIRNPQSEIHNVSVPTNGVTRRRAQSLVEYTVLVGTVVAAVALTQTYLRRALQARLSDAAREGASAAPQYEPYYLTSFGGKVEAKTVGQYQFSAGGAVTGSATFDITVKCLDPLDAATCPSQTVTPPPP